MKRQGKSLGLFATGVTRVGHSRVGGCELYSRISAVRQYLRGIPKFSIQHVVLTPELSLAPCMMYPRRSSECFCVTG